jgi:hypothetical protein
VFLMGRAHGKGMVSFADGSTYKGFWVNGAR